MNPRHLYTLTPACKKQYQVQPDEFPGYERDKSMEYELPPYLPKSTLRFWYNTQTVGFQTHWHDAQEIIIPLEDNYSVTVQGQEYLLEPGDILLIPPGDLHSICAPESGSRFIFLLGLDLFCHLEDFFYTRSLLSKPIHMTADTHPEIYEEEISLIMQTASHYFSNSPSRQLYVYACMMNFYARYTDFHVKSSHTPADKTLALHSKNPTQKLNQLLEYLQEHYAENISLDKASALTGISKFYLSRIFRQYTGQSYSEYLSFLRIQKAENLLKDTNIHISDISAACGYSSISSFNRAFRQLKGCSPSEYRKYHGHGT